MFLQRGERISLEMRQVRGLVDPAQLKILCTEESKWVP